MRKNSLFYSTAIASSSCLVLMTGADRLLATYARSLNETIREVFRYITEFGDSVIYLLPSFILFLVLKGCTLYPKLTDYRHALNNWAFRFLFLFASIGFSGLLVDLLKIFFGRSRPLMWFDEGIYEFAFFQFQSNMWSFPSGHANTAFCLATAVYLMRPQFGIPLFPLAFIVASSRVILGSHYPSDIVMGAFLAVATTLFVKDVFLRRGIDIFMKLAEDKKVRVKHDEAG
jgi:undecaprenyl-diphosphatase